MNCRIHPEIITLLGFFLWVHRYLKMRVILGSTSYDLFSLGIFSSNLPCPSSSCCDPDSCQIPVMPVVHVFKILWINRVKELRMGIDRKERVAFLPDFLLIASIFYNTYIVSWSNIVLSHSRNFWLFAIIPGNYTTELFPSTNMYVQGNQVQESIFSYHTGYFCECWVVD